MNDHEKLARCHAALRSDQVLRFSYQGAKDDEPRMRTISPYETYTAGAGRVFYVMGWDHEREAIRQFRLTHVDGIAIDTTVAFQAPDAAAIPAGETAPRARPRRT